MTQIRHLNLGEANVLSWCEDISQGNLEAQLADVANHPVLFKHVAVMPGAHEGYGMPIECVAAFKDAVVPYAVGMDIGCGMRSVKLPIEADALTESQLKTIREQILQVVPVGLGQAHETAVTDMTPSKNSLIAEALEFIPKEQWNYLNRSCGSLGAGNHFIELQKGNDGCLWLMIHSGSRKLGALICEHYHSVAEKLMKSFQIDCPRYLAYLPVDIIEGAHYWGAMSWALAYAYRSRQIMAERCVGAISLSLGTEILRHEAEDIDVHHNYADLESHFGKNVVVHRKGATSARKGQLGIIPGSMGEPSYIVRGLGNLDSFMSCSHGAGRAMSRKAAEKTLDPAKVKESMAGIVTGDYIPLDEAPEAYKDIGEVMAAQTDLISIETELFPIMNVKGQKEQRRKH